MHILFCKRGKSQWLHSALSILIYQRMLSTEYVYGYVEEQSLTDGAIGYHYYLTGADVCCTWVILKLGR